MDYNKKKKLNHNLLNLVTFLVVVFNLFPIMWMVYTSFMGNNEVMMGEIKMSHRENDGTFITSFNDEIIYGTTDGALSKYSLEKNLENTGYVNTNSFVPSYSEGKDAIWMFTADKGLIKIDKNSFVDESFLSFGDIIETYEEAKQVEVPKMYVTDMIRTNILVLDKEIILGFWDDRSFGLTIVNKETKEMTFVDESDGLKSLLIRQFVEVKDNKLTILTTKGLEILDLSTKKIVEVIQPIDREEFDVVAYLDDNTIAAFNSTARTLMVYERDGKYLKRIHELSAENGVKFTKATSLGVNATRDCVIFGTATTGKVIKIKYSKQPVEYTDEEFEENDATTAAIKVNNVNDSIEPAFEQPVEAETKTKMQIVFDTENMEIIENKINTSNDVLVFLEDGKGGIITGGDKGQLSFFNKDIAVSTVAPEGSLYIHWRNYIDVFKNIDFGLYLKNSLIICTSVMIISMFLASLAGYSLARYRFPGKDTFGYAVLATQMVPGIMFLIPIYLMFVKFNELTGIPVKGTYWSIIFTYSAFFVPFSIWILRGFFAGIPKELEEAALIDGCNPFQAFFKIIIPAAMPGIVATGIYVFLLAWDELMFAWILTNEHTYTIPVGIRNFAGNYQNRYDLMMAAATIATIPVMVLFFMMQKQIVSGLTSGAVKE